MEVGAAVELLDRSSVGELRREAASLGARHGLGEEAIGRVGIVATELAGNAVKHARGGWGFVSPAEHREPGCLQIVVVDSGPGLANPGAALADGYSTAGTRGEGLGAVRRLSCRFDLYTREDGGFAVVALAGRDPARPREGPLPAPEVAGVVAAKPGQTVCGDVWSVEREGGRTSVIVADGLGHGEEAAAAASAAIRAFHAGGGGAAERLERIHDALRPTRGAAVAVAVVDPSRSSLGYAGIGNIAGQILTAHASHNLLTMNGTAGGRARSIREFAYELPPDAIVVMHSDGVSSRWTLEPYPGLRLRDPALPAAVIFRDGRRGSDDAAVVVMRIPAHGAAPQGLPP